MKCNQVTHYSLFLILDDGGWDVAEDTQAVQIPVIASLFCQGVVEKIGQVLPLLPQGNVLNGKPAEALFQILDARRRSRVLVLSIDKKEHQADNDEGLDERGEEEDDAHVVATAFALRVVLHLLLGLGAVLWDLGIAAGVHGSWRTVVEEARDETGWEWRWAVLPIHTSFITSAAPAPRAKLNAKMQATLSG